MIAEETMTAAVAEQNELDVESLNAMFETADAARIVDWAVAQFGPEHTVMSSSFGAESAMLLHMATRIVPEMKVIFVDTGYLFPETHLFMEQLRRRLNLNVWAYRTMQDPIAWLKRAGETDPSIRNDRNICCAVNKNEPFERAMAELRPKAWLRGIRRDQASTRKDRKFVEWSSRFKCYAISPMLNMTRRDIHAYLKQHDLPYHPLFDKGYASIGCNPVSCTRPIQIGEDARAGRWAGSDKIECGINVDHNSLDSAQI
jgi:phosphoadenosine phosphosulfate reductase